MASIIYQNQLKIEAQDEVPLSIDFGLILMGFERQVGMKNRAKSDPKWIGKRIEKMIKESASGRRLGGGEATHAALPRVESWTPIKH